ncbi:MAG: Flp pilus assembly complex ATPase component TadA [Candidatus Riflebacteria bacterium]|nr:Flp pilus assembly complex ATPase component TadA [Candidatus Riflebacteria bacterium]
MKRIGDVLTDAGLLTHAQLQDALEYSRKHGLKMGEALIEMGLISESELLQCLSKQLGIAILPDKEITVDPSLVHEIPYPLAKKYNIIPLYIQNGKLVVVTSDPLNIAIVDELENRTKKPVSLILASSKKIAVAIEQYFSGTEHISQTLKQVQQIEDENLLSRIDVKDADINDTPVVKFVNQMLEKAVQEKASDIHIEIDTVDFHIRFRIDGILQTMFRPKPQLHPLIISRLKVMSRMDVSEHRISQDGRIKIKIESEFVDFRVATVPCMHGEKMVIRVLNQGPKFLQLSELGFEKSNLKRLELLITRKHGLVLVSGQTGSGKTTTMYSILRVLNREGVNIITLEDPVEIQLALLNQIQVNPKVDLTFANGLRSILRMDPDVIMVGEIRDSETAKLAINASMTGHLVLSTIHTGVAAEVPVRLMEMGVEPYLVANTLIGAIAQRLVRINCQTCREPEETPVQFMGKTKIDFKSFRGKGCPACNRTGYRGRTCIAEVLPIDSEIRQLFLRQSDYEQIHQSAVAAGMVPILDSGLEKVRAGLTSFEELARVI